MRPRAAVAGQTDALLRLTPSLRSFIPSLPRSVELTGSPSSLSRSLNPPTVRTSLPTRALLQGYESKDPGVEMDVDDNATHTTQQQPTLNATSESASSESAPPPDALVYACSGTCYAREPTPNGAETDRLTFTDDGGAFTMAVSVDDLRETEAYVKVPSSQGEGGGEGSDHFSGVVTESSMGPGPQKWGYVDVYFSADRTTYTKVVRKEGLVCAVECSSS